MGKISIDGRQSELDAGISIVKKKIDSYFGQDATRDKALSEIRKDSLIDGLQIGR